MVEGRKGASVVLIENIEDQSNAPSGTAATLADGVSAMRVLKRSGALEPVDLNKIVRAIGRSAEGLSGVDPMRIATHTISGLRDGASSIELDELSIRTAAALISEEPNYSRLAARLLSTVIDKEVRNQNLHSFSQSVAHGHELGLVADATAEFVRTNRRKFDDAIQLDNDRLFEFFGLRTVYDRYLLRDPEGRSVIETPQYFLLRVACGLAYSVDEAIELYSLTSALDYLPSSPTLFNSGTRHPPDVLVLLARLTARRVGVDLRALFPDRPNSRSSLAGLGSRFTGCVHRARSFAARTVSRVASCRG